MRRGEAIEDSARPEDFVKTVFLGVISCVCLNAKAVCTVEIPPSVIQEEGEVCLIEHLPAWIYPAAAASGSIQSVLDVRLSLLAYATPFIDGSVVAVAEYFGSAESELQILSPGEEIGWLEAYHGIHSYDGGAVLKYTTSIGIALIEASGFGLGSIRFPIRLNSTERIKFEVYARTTSTFGLAYVVGEGMVGEITLLDESMTRVLDDFRWYSESDFKFHSGTRSPVPLFPDSFEIPEPSSFWFMAAGASLTASLRRRFSAPSRSRPRAISNEEGRGAAPFSCTSLSDVA